MTKASSRLMATGALVVTAVAGVGALTLADRPAGSHRPTGANETRGVIVDELGQAVSGARVQTREGEAVTTNRSGAFVVHLDNPTLVTATAPDHKSRVQAIAPRTAPRIELTGQASRTISIRFGGDVMMGRRFYERVDGRPAQLTDPHNVQQHSAILSSVAPLLADGDLSVVNLETPLVDEPYYNPNRPRPKAFHPTKDLAFASGPATAKALKAAGVDAVSLGNNHSFDVLGPGLASTIKALDAAGVKHFGAGTNDAEAWKPAIVQAAGRRVALLACTTVDGSDHAIPYVAAAKRAGAALCTPAALKKAVTDARKQASYVAVMMHGGVEYQRDQTPESQSIFKVATEAGAQVVIGGHPHVVGGLTQSGGSVTAESMGNLTFDQSLWSTYPGYLLRVDLRDGAALRSTVDPLVMEHYRPVPSVGGVAQSASRLAAGSVAGPARLADNGAQVNASPPPPAMVKEQRLGERQIQAMAPGWWYSGTSAPVNAVRAGTDLLNGTGSFEQQGTDPGVPPGGLWTLGNYARLSNESRCDDGEIKGDLGLELLRSPLSKDDVVASPLNRQQVRPGQSLSLVADVRHAAKGARLELRWYRGAEGSSLRTTSETIPQVDKSAAGCRRVTINATVPSDARAVQVFLRLEPPKGGQETRRLAVDNVRLAQWAPEGISGRQYDMVRTTAAATGRFVRDLPGARASAETPVLEAPEPQ
ncbi:CapA family protein [Luteipulveratus mongoliensis]|uniref:Capsule synthesis protein CapA domain-containing protein n=1 Tax=Luteipulveratus mongoliensis TaxID=571913 RepID=A0A0K1JIJ8_9MICO|nr:CapA family protein [Luteipulveratus mongoliensis]AKU16547.1 hypothetical protein VV02_12895 [Luteipulveratus mongoliensis]